MKINTSTTESLPGVPGVSRNQKLSTEYDFYGLEVSLEVLADETLKNHKMTYKIKGFGLVFQSLISYNFKADLQTIEIKFCV